MGELDGRIFRHSLDLEAEDLQLMHYVGYASRYHSEVLTAAEHMGRMDQRRQFAHRRVTPELGMATEEIIIVDTHEDLFLIAVQLVERVALVDRDTRMEPSRTALVFYHQHFAMQVNQSVAEVLYRFFAEAAGFECFLVVQQTVCPFLHFRLRVKLRAEPVYIMVVGLQSVLFRPFGIVS